ncbi:MAG: translation initiation factor IF-2 subunit alpha [Euryarchaeota archaeon]|nr:translation initiation factor IF-2 subunit alpha [Euryarchaeota archaeon]
MVKLSTYPDEGELVVCTVRDVRDFGAFVTLSEYQNREGFIHVAEVATGWVKYIRDHVREGQKIVCKVLRVDQVKEHIDLSLKQVNEHARKEKIQEWKNEQRAEKLFEIVAQGLHRTVAECYQDFGKSLVEKYGMLYTAFEECAVDPKALERDGLKGAWTRAFVSVAQENIVPPRVAIHGYLELTCARRDGINRIKEALVKAAGTGKGQISIQYLGAPRYRILVNALDYKVAEDILQEAVDRALGAIKAAGGKGDFVREKGGSCAHT